MAALKSATVCPTGTSKYQIEAVAIRVASWCHVCNNHVRQFKHRDRLKGLRPCSSRSSLLLSCPVGSQKRTSSEATGKDSDHPEPQHQTTGRMRAGGRVAFEDFHFRIRCLRRWLGAQQQPELYACARRILEILVKSALVTYSLVFVMMTLYRRT